MHTSSHAGSADLLVCCLVGLHKILFLVLAVGVISPELLSNRNGKSLSAYQPIICKEHFSGFQSLIDFSANRLVVNVVMWLKPVVNGMFLKPIVSIDLYDWLSKQLVSQLACCFWGIM